jgi:predicted AlkP superfamily phosphohydrolase/phosphomutase
MGLFGLKRKNKERRRVVVIGIDGVPFSFLQNQLKAGEMSRLGRLVQQGSFRRMNSVIPTVSSVAWSSYMTGKNPGKHHIYGFIDRRPNPFEVYIPNSSSMKGKTLWEILSDHGKRVVVINVPVTYPPRPVNGILISGFLATRLEKAVYPQSLSQTLTELEYRIDVDAWKAHEDTDAFLEDVNGTLDRRIETAFYLMEKEDWDFFQVHIMETDRINHFLWEHWEKNDPTYAPEFQRFYRRLDGFLGEVEDRLDGSTELIILSDHGFCTLKKEVYLNRWLEDRGFLQLRASEKRTFKDMQPGSKAYSLIPGRIFVNVEGREEMGSVRGKGEYEDIRETLISEFGHMQDPDTGEKMVRTVYKKEDLYHGPWVEQAADLVVVPEDGYDLKGNLDRDTLTHKGPLVGMHTFDDAALYIRGREIKGDHISIGDVMPTLLNLMAVPVPEDVDGISCLEP